MCYKRKFDFSWCYTTSVLNVSLSLFFQPPLIFSYPLPYIGVFLFLSLQLFFCQLSFQGFFFSFISFFPSLILEFWLLRVFVLFRLSLIHSMQQMLGGNPLINAEVKIFNLLVCSGSLLRFQISSRNLIWIIRASRLG